MSAEKGPDKPVRGISGGTTQTMTTLNLSMSLPGYDYPMGHY